MAHRVYVIELDRGAGRRRDPRIPWVYVGSSAREPELRFDQHRRGYKSAGLVRRFALRLRPDLYEDLEPIRGSRRALEAELDRARELAAAGFVAHSDGVSHGAGTARWQEWGEERLALVGDHADAAIDELGCSSFAALDACRCAELLHGERGFWVADFIDPADPPPAYGLLSHVRLDALEERAAARSTIASASLAAAPGACGK